MHTAAPPFILYEKNNHSLDRGQFSHLESWVPVPECVLLLALSINAARLPTFACIAAEAKTET